MRYVVVGRHDFTPPQRRLLVKAGLTEEAGRIPQINTPSEPVVVAKNNNAEAIVIQALPMHLLAALLPTANKFNIKVYGFKVEAVATVPADQPCPEEADIEVVDQRSGNKRCSKTVSLQLLKRIIVDAEDVATLG